MKKMKKRALICLFFALILFLGTSFYVSEWIRKGNKWAIFPANKHIYHQGNLIAGKLLDRKDNVLLENKKGQAASYNAIPEIRRACVHLTGDRKGNISSGANVVFKDLMIGYNKITGVKSFGGSGRTLKLTIDANTCSVARQALGNYAGTVGVFNYKTGEILCMTSSPNYDPENPPKLSKDDKSGAYINRLTSAKIVPGSVFKLATAIAALESLDNPESWTYTCKGIHRFGDYEKDKITCLGVHGTVNIKSALAQSCNCAFGQLAIDVGPKKMKKYVKKLGLANSYDIDGIQTMPGSFDFPNNDLQLGWAGIGQHKDLVNPLSLMVLMGAIGNGGTVKSPYLISSVEFYNGLPADFSKSKKELSLLPEETASKMAEFMKNNVTVSYGEANFPNLDIYAKTGTAESGKNKQPNAWFTGFIKNEDHPYAFVALVEEGGTGISVAGRVANQVLQYMINE